MKGWKYEGHRHSLAARGIRTSFSKKLPERIVIQYGESIMPKGEVIVFDRKVGKAIGNANEMKLNKALEAVKNGSEVSDVEKKFRFTSVEKDVFERALAGEKQFSPFDT